MLWLRTGECSGRVVARFESEVMVEYSRGRGGGDPGVDPLVRAVGFTVSFSETCTTNRSVRRVLVLQIMSGNFCMWVEVLTMILADGDDSVIKADIKMQFFFHAFNAETKNCGINSALVSNMQCGASMRCSFGALLTPDTLPLQYIQQKCHQNHSSAIIHVHLLPRRVSIRNRPLF